jgi:hypothetical protein
VATNGQWERMVRSIHRVSFGWREASRFRRRANVGVSVSCWEGREEGGRGRQVQAGAGLTAAAGWRGVCAFVYVGITSR